MIHYHANADEVFFVISGAVQSTMISFTNTPIYHNLSAGQILVYPRGTPCFVLVLQWPLPAEPSGWLHYQYNPTCEPAITYLVFDASNIGTVNVINQLALVSLQYLNAAFALNYTHVPGVLGGEHPDIWVTNADCLKACGR